MAASRKPKSAAKGKQIKLIEKPEPKEDRLEDIKEHVEEIRDEIEDSGKDVEEIKEDVEEIKEDLEEIQEKQKSILGRISSKLLPEEFGLDDFAQQIVGAIVFSAPLAVTEEVWRLSQSLDLIHVIVIVLITVLFDVLLIHYTKIQNTKRETIFGVIPKRLFSLVLVSYITASVMLYVLGVIGGQVNTFEWAVKVIIFVGMFANIGAGAVDMLR
ncbi:MAG: hypothetical protein QT03_C0001G0485 [archaeon GW2011_AR10]|uniref:DUF2391 family protein n=1 Tax=Candidatus Iainarchaeum sp. TaxID=3101447 RepID=A0A7J4IV99_9ARCH|nr:MAG: hypothetical protein QT03_C0001G0485 [archaeon GW2011_AR10]HIH08740.1 DUF2391 family protein [Candidatus Diapherotrites archaeon]